MSDRGTDAGSPGGSSGSETPGRALGSVTSGRTPGGVTSGRVRIARRELDSLSREKTIVLALLIQLFIAAFSSFLLVGLVSMYDPGSAPGGDVTIGVAGNASEDLVAAIDGEGSWNLVGYDTVPGARSAFEAGRADATFVATHEPDGRVAVEAVVPDGSVRTTVLVVQVREALSAYEGERRGELSARIENDPLSAPDVPDVPPTYAFTYTVLLPLLLFLPAFISGSVAADSITEEIDGGTLELLRVTPLSATAIVDGKMLAMVAIAPAQAGAWLLLLSANGTAIANPLWLLAVVTGVSALLVAVGVGLALWLGDRRSTQLVYSLAVLVVFALAALGPESPPNTIARLAIDSALPRTYVVAAGYVAVAALAVLLVRSAVPRTIGE